MRIKKILNKSILTILLLTFVIASLTNCASTPPPIPESDVLMPEIDLIQVKENSDEALRNSQETKLDVEVMASRIAEFNNQLMSFSEEMASVSSAKIEELEHKVAVLTEEVKNIYRELDSMRVRLKMLSRPKPPVVFTLNTLRPGSREAGKIFPPDVLKYREGESLFNSKKFLMSIIAFKTSLKKNPNGKYADNAHYWIGECYYLLGQWARAIAEYKKVFSFSNSDKSDDSQLKIAFSYEKLGDIEQALSELKHFIKTYPHSNLNNTVKKNIRKLEGI